MTGYYTGNPVLDAERYTADMEAEAEASRRRRVMKCTATLWFEVEHATDDEAEAEAYEFFSRLFSGADDAEFRVEEER